ncbi:chalcone isomerase family protein [Deefgea piscis]|uniref:Chalcone isomerase family protein n=1 Tax=Deefgea piscis TaxID=2739061 RepID=A0A6M8SQ96_9NEIS|nr:chalcone isomerase family protein [Deefgea piscis]QKJ67422.1 chalcone isomerase family protein [Deefgea piscis]
MFINRIALSALFAMACIAIPAQAAIWREHIPQAQAIGSGDLRWFGLRIYTAKLWSEKKPFDLNAPFALELTYHRNISREQFVETSLDEIKRLFGTRYSADTLKRWEGEMQRAFTDVKAGDQLIGVFIPNEGVRFYSGSKLLTDIRNPEFAKAFFAIWFDARSKDKDLRAQLLGNSP